MVVENEMNNSMRIKQEPRDDFNYHEYAKYNESLQNDVKLECNMTQYENTVLAQQQEDNILILQNLTDDEIISEFECHDVKPTIDSLRTKISDFAYAHGFDEIKSEGHISHHDEVVNKFKSELSDSNKEQTIEKFEPMHTTFYCTNEKKVNSKNFKKGTSVQEDSNSHPPCAKPFSFEISCAQIKSASNLSNAFRAVDKYKDHQRHIDSEHKHFKPFKFHVYQKVLGQKQDLISSHGVRNKIKLYDCEMCPKSFRSKKTLKNHIDVVHNHLKPYKCEVCQKAFGQKIHLKVHTDSVHNNLKPYKCEVCQEVFGQKQHLKNHIDVVHNHLKPYKCEVCKKAYGRKYYLPQHIDIVHNNLKPYKCEVCQKVFGLNCNLKKHIDAVHKHLKPYKFEVC